MPRRNARGVALALLALQAGCLTVTIRTRVLPDGSVERILETSPHSAEVARATAARFPAPWRVELTASGKGIRAEVRVDAGGDLAPNEAGLHVTWQDYVLFTDYRYEEDFSRVRLGRAAPMIAPRPPAGPPATTPLLGWLRGLFHERNLSAIERRAREELKTHLEVALPGAVRDGNFTTRTAGGELVWDFNFRAPAAPWATSRVWHPGRALVLAVAGIAVLLLVRRRAGEDAGKRDGGGRVDSGPR